VTTTMHDWLKRLQTASEDAPKNLPPDESGRDKSAESQHEDRFVACGTPGVVGREVFGEMARVAAPSEAIIVDYQRFSLGYDLRDGTYTPEELRRVKLLVNPGPVLRYRLRWPGGAPQPMAENRWLFGGPPPPPRPVGRKGPPVERDSGEYVLRARRQSQVEATRRAALQEARLKALTAWLAGPCTPPVVPEKSVCQACQTAYARGEPGSTWRFCAACLGREGSS
jgi:hypothetical protein